MEFALLSFASGLPEHSSHYVCVFSASVQPDDGQYVGSFSAAVGRSALHGATIKGHIQNSPV